MATEVAYATLTPTAPNLSASLSTSQGPPQPAKPNGTDAATIPSHEAGVASKEPTPTNTVPSTTAAPTPAPSTAAHSTPAATVPLKPASSTSAPSASSLPKITTTPAPPTHDATPADQSKQQPPPRSPHFQQLMQAKAWIENADAGILRQALRLRADKCLGGSVFHSSFMFNFIVAMDNSKWTFQQPQTKMKLADRLIEEDFDMLTTLFLRKSSEARLSTKVQMVQKIFGSDSDAILNVLLQHSSEDFLDRALARRLETIPAQKLVNALCRAERLGYRKEDVQEEGALNELLIFSEEAMSSSASEQQEPQPAPAAAAAPPPPPPPARSPNPPQQQKHQHLTTPHHQPSPQPSVPGGTNAGPCATCHQYFVDENAFIYHVRRKACVNNAKYSGPATVYCPRCARAFANGTGLAYHKANNVCGVPNTLPSRSASSASSTPVVPSPVIRSGKPAAQTPVPATAVTPAARSLPQSPHTATSELPPITPRPGFGPASASPMPADIINHLSESEKIALEAEMLAAETTYGSRMQALSTNSPSYKSDLAGLKNCFNTKQCMIRKKYGVKLRDKRRTKAEVEAQMSRMMPTSSTPIINAPAYYRNAASSQHADKRSRTGVSGAGIATHTSGGAADTPTRKQPNTAMYASMANGLLPAAANSEMLDPTERRAVRQSPHLEARFASSPALGGASFQQAVAVTAAAAAATAAQPLAVDSDSDSDSDLEDIPASLPKQVKT